MSRFRVLNKGGESLVQKEGFSDDGFVSEWRTVSQYGCEDLAVYHCDYLFEEENEVVVYIRES